MKYDSPWVYGVLRSSYVALFGLTKRILVTTYYPSTPLQLTSKVPPKVDSNAPVHVADAFPDDYVVRYLMAPMASHFYLYVLP